MKRKSMLILSLITVFVSVLFKQISCSAEIYSIQKGPDVSARTGTKKGEEKSEPISPKGSFSFIQICDTQLGQSGIYEHDVKTFNMAVDQINSMKEQPAFVIICGDLINGNHGNPGVFTHLFADFKKIADRFKMKVYCLPGNHDIGKYPNPRSLTQYREQMGKDYDSFEYGGYTFILVNTLFWWSTVTPKEEIEKQDEWFRSTLEKAQKGKIIVCGHHPLFLDNPREERGAARFTVMSEKRDELLALFEKYGVVAYLSAHQHANIINTYKGILFVTSAATCVNGRNKDGSISPLGYRIWFISNQPPLIRHEYVPLKGGL